MRITGWMVVVLLAWVLAVRAGDTGTDPLQNYAWGENVVGQVAVPGTGEAQTLTDEEGSAIMFYSIEVKVSP